MCSVSAQDRQDKIPSLSEPFGKLRINVVEEEPFDGVYPDLDERFHYTQDRRGNLLNNSLPRPDHATRRLPFDTLSLHSSYSGQACCNLLIKPKS